MKKALGKGLNALIPDSYKAQMAETSKEVFATATTIEAEPEINTQASTAHLGGQAFQLIPISLIAPNATINKIKNYKVVAKDRVKLPAQIIGSITCSNPNCITNHEPMDTIFNVENIKPIRMRCEYCERSISEGEIKLI